MKSKIKQKATKHLQELVEIFDNMHDKMTEYMQTGNVKLLQFLTQETITNCSNSIQNEDSLEIDEKIKAKIYTRLVREYRRSLENQQRQMLLDQRAREIE